MVAAFGFAGDGGKGMKRYEYMKTLSMGEMAEFLSTCAIYISDEYEDVYDWLNDEVEKHERIN